MIKIPRREQNKLLPRPIRIDLVPVPVKALLLVPHAITLKLAHLVAQSYTRVLPCPPDLVRASLLRLLLLLFALRAAIPLVPPLHSVNVVAVLPDRAEQAEIRALVQPFQPARAMIVTARRWVALIPTSQRSYLRSTPVEVVAKVMVLLQLHLEERYRVQQLLSRSWIFREHVGRFDLIDRFVQVAAYPVLTSTVQIRLLWKLNNYVTRLHRFNAVSMEYSPRPVFNYWLYDWRILIA